MDGMQLSIGLVFLAGMVSFLSPCILPVVPAYLSVISGMSFEQLSQQDAVRQARWRLLSSALAFLLGFSVVTVLLLGGIASLVSGLGDAWRIAFRWIGGGALIVFALHLLGIVRINALFQERRFHLQGSRWGLLGVVLIGAAFGFGWSPCIGPILGGVLAFAAGTASPATAWWYLIAYTLGLAVPFVLSALFVNLFLGSMRRFTRHLRTVEVVAGVLLLVMGGLLFADKLTLISAKGGYLLELSQRIEGMLQ